MYRRQVLTTLASLAALTTAFAAPVTAQTTPMGDGSVIRLMTSPAGTQSFPPYVIERFGLDEKYGFQLEIVPSGNTAATVNGMLGGAAEMATLDWVTIARLRSNDVPIMGVVPFLAYVNTIIVQSDIEASTAADLAGLRVGALSKTSFDWIMTLAAARSEGVELSTAAEIIEGAPSLMRGMLEQGQIDATLMWNSLTPDTVLDGRFRVMTTIRELATGLGLPDAPFVIYAANTDWAADNTDNVTAFVAAYREAVEILMTNDEVWIDRAVGEMGMAEEAAAMFRDLVRNDLLTHFNEADNETLQATFDVLFPIAGEEVFGFSEMPESILTFEYN